MKFQIEQILTIKDKAYLFCKGLDTSIFKLSDTCRLGKFEIENWFDIPIEPLETNGNERKDAFVFVLKKLDDREKISLGDVLELSTLSAKVIQSAYTVSGAIILILECGAGMLDEGTLLSSPDGKTWKITKNGFVIGRPKDEKLQKRVVENCWFQYKLQAINHSELLQTGVELLIVKNDIIV